MYASFSFQARDDFFDARVLYFTFYSEFYFRYMIDTGSSIKILMETQVCLHRLKYTILSSKARFISDGRYAKLQSGCCSS